MFKFHSSNLLIYVYNTFRIIKMQYFKNLMDEIKINIFKRVIHPLNLALSCRNWSIIAKDPYAKTEWLIEHYGKEHAFFYAVRLGLTFIDLTVCQSLIERKVLSSRYFVQILLKHLRMYNQKLVELKIEHNFNHSGADTKHAFQQKIASSWTRNLLIFTFINLLNERESINVRKDLLSNDTELANPCISNVFAETLSNNLKDIKYSINKLITFPSKSIQLNFKSVTCTHKSLLIPEKYRYPLKNKFDPIKFFDFLQKEIFLRYDINKLYNFSVF